MRELAAAMALSLCGQLASAQMLKVTTGPAAPTPSLVEPVGFTMVRFDPNQLALKKVDGRWQIIAGKQFLKDFGPQEREAAEALRLIRDLQFCQYGTIAGAIPAFEFWLEDEGNAPKGGFASKTVISFNARTLRVEQVTGAWVIRDDKMLLYNFGNDEAAAKQAFDIMKKHGFNQLGIIGAPRPVMTYLTVDQYSRVDPKDARNDVRDMINTISQQGLMLPKIGYAGAKLPIESRKLEAVKVQKEWVVSHGREVIARFGTQERKARDAVNLLQDCRVSEIVIVGSGGFPVYLASGKAPRTALVGTNVTRITAAQLTVKKQSDSTQIMDGRRAILTFANSPDAELVVKVLQHFEFDQFTVLGDPSKGGLRFFAKSK